MIGGQEHMMTDILVAEVIGVAYDRAAHATWFRRYRCRGCLCAVVRKACTQGRTVCALHAHPGLDYTAVS
jgi:hypothetical protein